MIYGRLLTSVLLFLALSALSLTPSYSGSERQIESPQKKYVKTFADFHRLMSLHRERARIEALEARERFKDRYKDVPLEWVNEFMGVHDLAKMENTRSFRDTHHIQEEHPTLLYELYEFYGENVRSLKEKGEVERANRLQAVIDEINRIDAEVAMKFFRDHNLVNSDGSLKKEAELLLELEKLGDLVDRGMSEVTSEEMGTRVTPASEFLQALKKPKLAEMAKVLETDYQKKVGRLSYSSVTARCAMYRAAMTAWRLKPPQ